MSKKHLALALGAMIAVCSTMSTSEAVRLSSGDTRVPLNIPSVEQMAIDTEIATQDELRAPVVVSNVDQTEFLNQMAGEWYDVRNYHHLTVDPSIPAINGCEIISFKATGSLDKGTAEITLKESSGNKVLKLSWIADPKQPINTCINVEGYPSYRHTPSNHHAESVAGFHLWMSPGEVRERLGEDGQYMSPEQTAQKVGINVESSYFEDGVIFTYSPYNEMIDRIIVLKESDLSFDRFGLNCQSPLKDFAQAYGWSTEPKVGDVVQIADHQYISFKNYPESIELTIYPEG